MWQVGKPEMARYLVYVTHAKVRAGVRVFLSFIKVQKYFMFRVFSAVRIHAICDNMLYILVQYMSSNFVYTKLSSSVLKFSG